MFRTLQATWPL